MKIIFTSVFLFFTFMGTCKQVTGGKVDDIRWGRCKDTNDFVIDINQFQISNESQIPGYIFFDTSLYFKSSIAGPITIETKLYSKFWIFPSWYQIYYEGLDIIYWYPDNCTPAACYIPKGPREINNQSYFMSEPLAPRPYKIQVILKDDPDSRVSYMCYNIYFEIIGDDLPWLTLEDIIVCGASLLLISALAMLCLSYFRCERNRRVQYVVFYA